MVCYVVERNITSSVVLDFAESVVTLTIPSTLIFYK